MTVFKELSNFWDFRSKLFASSEPPSSIRLDKGRYTPGGLAQTSTMGYSNLGVIASLM